MSTSSIFLATKLGAFIQRLQNSVFLGLTFPGVEEEFIEDCDEIVNQIESDASTELNYDFIIDAAETAVIIFKLYIVPAALDLEKDMLAVFARRSGYAIMHLLQVLDDKVPDALRMLRMAAVNLLLYDDVTVPPALRARVRPSVSSSVGMDQSAEFESDAVTLFLPTTSENSLKSIDTPIHETANKGSELDDAHFPGLFTSSPLTEPFSIKSELSDEHFPGNLSALSSFNPLPETVDKDTEMQEPILLALPVTESPAKQTTPPTLPGSPLTELNLAKRRRQSQPAVDLPPHRANQRRIVSDPAVRHLIDLARSDSDHNEIETKTPETKATPAPTKPATPPPFEIRTFSVTLPPPSPEYSGPSPSRPNKRSVSLAFSKDLNEQIGENTLLDEGHVEKKRRRSEVKHNADKENISMP